LPAAAAQVNRTGVLMSRKLFLTVAAAIAFGVGFFALMAPDALLASKGIQSAAAAVWVREVGIFLLALALLAYLVRNHADSPTMKAVSLANALIQFGLFPIEIASYAVGTIAFPSGFIPNSIIHVVLGLGFLYYATAIRNP
jgi:hypothetical protein